MKYLWYAFLGLFSLGFLGLVVVIGGVAYLVNQYSKDLPDYSQLSNYTPPVVTRLYAGDGRLLAEFAEEKRIFVPVTEIPDLVKQAFISAEDKNFYNHEGVDPLAIFRAALSNVMNIGSGRRMIGASTITQQVAKNFLLTNEVSFKRKIREAILAYRMDQAMTKDKLLELYLNEIYLGGGTYGVAAAALYYFNKSLDEVTIPEAAFLAALPKAPNNYHPVRRHDAALERRNWVITRMLSDGYITKGQEELAQATPLEMAGKGEADVVGAPYFTEEVRRQLASQYGSKDLYGGGLAVRTTVDPRLQDVAVRTLRKGLMEYDRRHGWRGPVTKFESFENWRGKLEKIGRTKTMLESWRMAYVIESSATEAKLGFVDGPDGVMNLEGVKWARACVGECYNVGPEITAVNEVVKTGDVVMVEEIADKKNTYELQQVPLIQGAIVAMDPHTGRVLATQGGWTYDGSEFNRATQADRQPGSAFKPFIYMAALDNGFTPSTLILDAPFAIEDRPGNIWRPTNYSGEFYGPTPLRVGVEKSRNLMTVRLADNLGMDKIADYAEKFGISEDMPHMLSYSLGAGETTLLKLTTAYAMIVNGGKKITPTFLDRVQDRTGKTVYRHDARDCVNCGQLIRWEDQMAPDVPDTREQIEDPRTAYQMVSILEGVIQRGTAMAIKELDLPLAGKTGTTNRSHDTWFMGFSPDLVVGVFAGFDEPRSLGKRETGASIAVPIFKDFMQEALKDQLPTPFRIPPGIKQMQVNAETGVRARAGGNVIWEAFKTGEEPGSQMSVLESTGITEMPDLSGGITDSPITGTGGLY